MVVLLLMLLLLTALVVPVTFRIDAQHHGATTWRIAVKYAFLSRTWQSGNNAGGSTALQQRMHKFLSSISRSRHLPSAGVRRWLKRIIRLDALDALILIHTGDAAGAALLAGALQGLALISSSLQRKIRIRVLPDFFRGQTVWQVRCIFHTRPGIILLTMLMLPAARLQQKARTAYGTSHW